MTRAFLSRQCSAKNLRLEYRGRDSMGRYWAVYHIGTGSVGGNNLLFLMWEDEMAM